MAAKHPTAKGRSDHNRSGKGRRARLRNASSNPPLDRAAFRERLASLVGTVRNAMYVVTVCSDALRHEASGNSPEVATILQVYAADKIYGAVREAAVLLALFDGNTDVDPEGEAIGRMTDPE